MLKKSNKIFRILLLPAVIFSLALGIFRAYALVNCIEPQTGLYYDATVVKPVFSILVIFLVLFVLVCRYFTRKIKEPRQLDSESTFTAFTSALCAVLYLVVFVYGVYTFFKGFASALPVIDDPFKTNQNLMYRLVNAAPDVTSNGILFLIQIVLCIPAMLNHLSICTKKVREKNRYYAILSLGETLFFALRIVEVFMDTKSQINTSQRSLEILALCAVMLFFLYESRFLVSAEQENGIGAYYASAIATVCFMIVAVLPYLAVSVFWLYTPKFPLVYVLECCAALFALARIITLEDSREQGE